VAVALSSCGGVAIGYTFPVLRMTSRLAVVGQLGRPTITSGVATLGRLNFWQISVNISKTAQNRDILTMEDQWEISRPYMSYQMAAMAVTLNDLEGHSQVAGLFKCNPSNVCAALYTISTDRFWTCGFKLQLLPSM